MSRLRPVSSKSRRSGAGGPGGPGAGGNDAPPRARRDGLVIEQHGHSRTDPYAWLKDENWREVMRDPTRLRADIRAYLEAENGWTKDTLEGPTAKLQDQLFEEMKGRIKEDDSSVPAIDGPWAYYRRFREGGEYPLLCRRPTEHAYDVDATSEQVLLDGDKLAEGLEYFDIRKASHSPDHRFIAYAIDDKGSEFYTLRVRDCMTGEDIAETIPDTYGEFVWAEDSSAIYWVARDANARPAAVHRRELGTQADILIYREEDAGFFVGVVKSESRKFIFITAHDHTTTEWRVFDALATQPQPLLIAERTRGVDYSVVDFDNQFWIRTNAGGAVDFQLMTAPYDAPGPRNWKTMIPHRPGVLLLEIEAFAGHLARLERENGLPRIVIRERGSGAEHTIAFDAAAYSLNLATGFTWDTSILRFDYSSPAQPAQVFDYDMAARTRQLRKTQVIPSGHVASDYVVERIDAPAHDGALIPVTLIRHRNTAVDGKAPVLLYGYGAYGITIPSDFRAHRLSLVERGFIYAIADVRGSMAKGYQWYLDGKLEKKTNTFADYVAAGRHLVELGYTQEGRIVGIGGSAGGLLMGAAANRDPLLFAGIVAAVPFVDVLTTMSDAELPLTPPEWPEWGNPLEAAEDYLRIAEWSPYDQTTDKPYPPMLVTGGLTDPRVTYWEPAKWVAKMRHEAPKGGPYFLRINMEAGHGGATGRFASLRETALEYAFALAAVGKAEGVRLKP